MMRNEIRISATDRVFAPTARELAMLGLRLCEGGCGRVIARRGSSCLDCAVLGLEMETRRQAWENHQAANALKLPHLVRGSEPDELLTEASFVGEPVVFSAIWEQVKLIGVCLAAVTVAVVVCWLGWEIFRGVIAFCLWCSR
jgi:hypothetical protein